MRIVQMKEKKIRFLFSLFRYCSQRSTTKNKIFITDEDDLGDIDDKSDRLNHRENNRNLFVVKEIDLQPRTCSEECSKQSRHSRSATRRSRGSFGASNNGDGDDDDDDGPKFTFKRRKG